LGPKSFLRRNWRSFFILLSFTADAVVIITTSALSAVIVDLIPNVPTVSLKFYFFFTWYSMLIILGTGLIMGLYRSAFHTNKAQQKRLAGKVYLYSFLIILASFTVFKVQDYQRGFLLPFFALLPFVYSFGRWILYEFNSEMQRLGYGIHNALIVGYENGGMEVFWRFKGFPELGYNVRGLVLKNPQKNQKSGSMPKIRQYAVKELEEVVKRERIDRAFVPSEKFITNGYSELIEICRRERIKLKVLSPEADQLLDMAKVNDIAGITLYAPERIHIDAIRKKIKRLFDIVATLCLLLLLSPVFIVTILSILVESGRPVFFKQKRSSTKGGRAFYFYKFRSMVKNADELKDSLFRNNESDGALFKMKNDPRMTRVGRFIRKYSIDELPQLFNVLKGDMSLVGPRPLPVKDYDKVKVEEEFWEAIRDREKVKPGMTGLWQISGRSNVGFKEMVLLDLYYVENQSLLFDLEILFATIPVVVFGKGAY
jgi:exopolysaccharide biosynthesis polyprenyl glycosylphosphotransferase